MLESVWKIDFGIPSLPAWTELKYIKQETRIYGDETLGQTNTDAFAWENFILKKCVAQKSGTDMPQVCFQYFHTLVALPEKNIEKRIKSVQELPKTEMEYSVIANSM